MTQCRVEQVKAIDCGAQEYADLGVYRIPCGVPYVIGMYRAVKRDRTWMNITCTQYISQVEPRWAKMSYDTKAYENFLEFDENVDKYEHLSAYEREYVTRLDQLYEELYENDPYPWVYCVLIERKYERFKEKRIILVHLRRIAAANPVCQKQYISPKNQIAESICSR